MYNVRGFMLIPEQVGAADHFCIACRDRQLHAVSQVYRVPHYDFVPLGQGCAVATELTCRSCGVTAGFRKEVASLVVAAKPSTDHPNAASALEPWGNDWVNARMEIERRMREGRIESGERAELLAEPFLALNYLAKSKRGSRRSITYWLVVAWVLCGVWVLWLGLIRSEKRFPARSETMTFYASLAGLAAFAGFILYRVETEDRSSARRWVLQPLARSLRPLSPTPAEIEECMGSLVERELSLIAISLYPREVIHAVEKNEKPV